MLKRLLSKSKYLNGLQCPKYLWLLFNDKAKIPETDASTQHIFDEGHKVGELAKQMFPDGIDIPDADFNENLRQTKAFLGMKRPLFEAGFYKDGFFSRLDILTPVLNSKWDIYEVKASTSVKDVNIHDISFQRHCAIKSGLDINRCFIIHINNQYVKKGEIDFHQLFIIEDITEKVLEVSGDVETRAGEMWQIIESTSCPEIPIGQHCSDPYDCPVTWCRETLPENTILDLYRGGKKCFDLFEQGVLFIKDIPEGYKLSSAQQIQKLCEINQKPHIDKTAIREFCESLKYPLYYLDFETFSPVVPIYDGTKPYQRIPFQFSLHIVEKAGASPEHFGFLADGKGDPRPDFYAELKKYIGKDGNIVVYNQTFEKGILKELGEAFPEYDDWIKDISDRVIDLLVPFRNFDYYHPDQQGSASIKKVLPAMTGKGYEGLEIAKGDDASLAFFNILMGTYDEEEKQKIRQDLIKYCGLDTEAMILIVKKLMSLY